MKVAVHRIQCEVKRSLTLSTPVACAQTIVENRIMKYLSLLFILTVLSLNALADQPNIILVMADDQGWGQMGYYDHPVLKTPHLDEMAQHSLRFDRFYAAAPVCSPTRASVLTGRTNMRTGVQSHGYALRLQEKTIATALQNAGYATGHFGKWHLNGMRVPASQCSIAIRTILESLVFKSGFPLLTFLIAIRSSVVRGSSSSTPETLRKSLSMKR